MTRVDELVTDLELLIREHYTLEMKIEEITKLKTDIKNIKAEITDLADADAYNDYQQGFNFGLMRAVQIIDKYSAKSEDKE